jgi:peroxiredoxin
MSVRKLVYFLVFIALASVPLLAQAPRPRKSPEFSISEASGDEILLSSFKGKVVVMEFMFIGSAHCLRLAQMLNKLQGDLGSRGFQSIAIAFGQHADQSMVGHIVERLGLNYPVGYSTSGDVDAYLGREGNEKLKIPQMIVIDRKGAIRAATGTGADASLEDENSLRNLVDALLKEPTADNPKGSRKP